MIQQLNNKLLSFVALKLVAVPPSGWIKAIRTTLGMSMQQACIPKPPMKALHDKMIRKFYLS